MYHVLIKLQQHESKFWENKKFCENTFKCFHNFFEFPNFIQCSYNYIETGRTCFLFHLENSMTYLIRFEYKIHLKEKENNLFTLIIKMFMPLITSTDCASSVFLFSYKDTVLNQSVCIHVFSLIMIIFLKLTMTVNCCLQPIYPSHEINDVLSELLTWHTCVTSLQLLCYFYKVSMKK